MTATVLGFPFLTGFVPTARYCQWDRRKPGLQLMLLRFPSAHNSERYLALIAE